MTLLPTTTMTTSRGLLLALALSMGAAISLGITRFAYGLLLPPMRADLHWSYTLAGAMNTLNALGYLLGALATPFLLKRFGASRLLLWASIFASVCMVFGGLFVDPSALLTQRFIAGVSSAWVFVCGGLMAARLGASMPGRSGFVLGIYYGGCGFGITVSALLVPAAIEVGGKCAACLGMGLVGAGIGMRLCDSDYFVARCRASFS